MARPSKSLHRGAFVVLLLGAAALSGRGAPGGSIEDLTAPLYTTFTLHVDPGGGMWATEPGWEEMKFRLDTLGTMMEDRGLRLTVACSENFIIGCESFSTPGVAAIDDPGTLTNLADRGHDVQYHRHGGDINSFTGRLEALTGEPVTVVEGFATNAELIANGYDMLGGSPKDVATQLIDVSTRPFRVNGDSVFEEDVTSPILRGAGGPGEGTGFEPDNLDLLTKAFEHSFTHREAGKIQIHNLVMTHPDEYTGSHPTIEADVANLGSWLDAEIMGLIAGGDVVYVLKSDIPAIYDQWIALGGTNEDIFPSSAPTARASFEVVDSSTSGLLNDRVADVHTDTSGRVWFGHAGSIGGGIARLNVDGSWDSWTKTDGLTSGMHVFLFDSASAVIHSVAGRDLADPTSFAGLSTLTPIGWVNQPLGVIGSSGFLWEGVSEPDGDIYIGTGDGLSRRIAGVWDSLTPLNSPLPFKRVYGVADRTGEKWLATTGGGLAILDDQGTPGQLDDDWTFHTEASSGGGLLAETLRDVEFDGAGGAWVATLYGASYLASDGTWTGYEPDTSGLGYHNLVSALVDSQGDVWFGTYGRGASRFQPDTGLWDVYTRGEGHLANDHVTDIEEDADGNIWFAAFHGGGVTRLNRNLIIPNPPQPGGTFTTTLRGTPLTTGYVAISLGPAEFDLAGWGTVEIDPSLVILDTLIPIGPTGTGSATWPVPNDASLTGFGPIYIQGAVDGALTHREQTLIL